MTKKPGVYSTKIYALRCRASGCYVSLRAWSYHGSHDLEIRRVEFRDTPVGVARSEKGARKLVDLLPASAATLLQDADEKVSNAQRRLDHMNNMRMQHVSMPDMAWYQEQLDETLRERSQLADLISVGPEILCVEIRTEVTECRI